MSSTTLRALRSFQREMAWTQVRGKRPTRRYCQWYCNLFVLYTDTLAFEREWNVTDTRDHSLVLTAIR